MAKPKTLEEILDAAERRIKEGKGISHNEFWKRVEDSTRWRERNGNGQALAHRQN